MRRWMRRGTVVLGIVVIGLALTVYWLFYDNRLPTDGQFPLNLAELRAAAGRSALVPNELKLNNCLTMMRLGSRWSLALIGGLST